MHGLFSKPQLRQKWILKLFNTAFSIAFYVPGFAHACEAAGGSGGAEAGRQHARAVQHSRKSTARSTGSGTNNCSLWAREPPLRLCGRKTNTSIASSHRNIFLIVGHFLWKHKRNPSAWWKSFSAKKKIKKQELGSDEVVSPPSPFYCRGD